MEGVGGDDGVCGRSLNEVGDAASQVDGRGRALALPALGGAEGRAALLPSRPVPSHPLRPGAARAGRREASLSAPPPRAAGGQQRGGVAAGERRPGGR